jgi:hypothetical protein
MPQLLIFVPSCVAFPSHSANSQVTRIGASTHCNGERVALEGRQAGSRPKDSTQPQRKPRGLKPGDARHCLGESATKKPTDTLVLSQEGKGGPYERCRHHHSHPGIQ